MLRAAPRACAGAGLRGQGRGNATSSSSQPFASAKGRPAGKPKVKPRAVDIYKELKAKRVREVNEKIDKGESLTATETRYLTPVQLVALLQAGLQATFQGLVPGADKLTDAQRLARKFFFRVLRRTALISFLGYLLGNVSMMVRDHRSGRYALDSGMALE